MSSLPASPSLASARHIPSLDGIRALSFLVVFLDHSSPPAVLRNGDLGVTTFFLLSGFLITTLMRREFDNYGSVAIGHFYLRRALRIMPPLYLVLLAASLTALLFYPRGTLDGPTLAAQALFYANYQSIYGTPREIPGTGGLWSLAVEEHFYLLFPWLYVAMRTWRLPRPGQAALLWGLCALIMIWRCYLVSSGPRSGHIYGATDTRADSILFGCALAVWNNPALDQPRLASSVWKYCLLPVAVAALIASLAIRSQLFRQTGYFSLQGAALALLLVAAIRFHAWPLFRWLNYRPIAFIGVLSYSLYLVHAVLLSLVERLWPQWHAPLRSLVALCASLLISWAIYLCVERPCARLRKKLSER
jgi:peptidoglycan/LPS O-acetylase OafA/YrhL